jgi:hypothetical protein
MSGCFRSCLLLWGGRSHEYTSARRTPETGKRAWSEQLGRVGGRKILNGLYAFGFEQNAPQWTGGSGHDGDCVGFGRYSVATKGQ